MAFSTAIARPLLVIMAKQPEMGRVKTRLGLDIGAVEATRFYRHNLFTLLRRFRDETRWDTKVALAPDTALFSYMGLYGLPLLGQGRGDLGQRMQAIFNAPRRGAIIIVGSDIPHITTAKIADAFKKLEQVEAVLGAGEDGGYWLVGMKRRPSVLQGVFNNVAWSAPTTLEDTLRNLTGRKVALLDVLNDVDDGQDYHAWRIEGAKH